MAYLYRHIRLDTNEVFYVGISNNIANYTRANSEKNRNKWWKNITSKTEYEVEIIFEHEDYEFIKEKEREFIKLYGRKDLGLGILVNLTNGGEGVSGRVMSEEQKNKLRVTTGDFFRGVPKTEKQKQKMREAQTGDKSHSWGKKTSKETSVKISIAKSGINNHNSKKLEDVITGDEYVSVKEASEKLNINYSTLRAIMQGKLTNTTNLKYTDIT